MEVSLFLGPQPLAGGVSRAVAGKGGLPLFSWDDCRPLWLKPHSASNIFSLKRPNLTNVTSNVGTVKYGFVPVT